MDNWNLLQPVLGALISNETFRELFLVFLKMLSCEELIFDAKKLHHFLIGYYCRCKSYKAELKDKKCHSEE